MENACVAMPILSTHELARNGHKIVYDEDEGYIIHKQTGDVTKFIQHSGVYFLQLFVPKNTGADNSKGFQRQG